MKRWPLFLVLALLAVAIVLQVLTDHAENAHWWEHVPGFWAGYALAIVALLAAAVRWLGPWLVRPGKEDQDEP